MKAILALIIFSFSLGLQSYSCSCGYYEYDFCKNVSPETEVAMFLVDSVWYDSTDHRYDAYLIVLKSYSFREAVGTKHHFQGGKGWDCLTMFDTSQVGDTLIAIACSFGCDSSMGDLPYYINLQGNTYCGEPHVWFKNGIAKNPFDVRTIREIEDCLIAGINGTQKIKSGREIDIYPNPSSGNFHIDLNDYYENVQVVLLNIKGQIVHRASIQNSSKSTVHYEGPAGIYFLELNSQGATLGRKKILLK